MPAARVKVRVTSAEDRATQIKLLEPRIQCVHVLSRFVETSFCFSRPKTHRSRRHVMGILKANGSTANVTHTEADKVAKSFLWCQILSRQ